MSDWGLLRVKWRRHRVTIWPPGGWRLFYQVIINPWHDGVEPPSCSQSLSHLLCQICANPLVFLGGKTVGPPAPVSKVESKTFHRRKRTLQAFSRRLEIDELVLLVFGGWMIGMVTCYCRICQGCHQGISLKDQLITSHLDEWMVSQRMISRVAQIMLTI